MLHCSTYIYSVVLTYKTCQNIFCFCLENWHFYIQVYLGKCMFCYFLDIRAMSLYENDVHIVNISNGNTHLSCSVILYQVLTHTKRGPSDPARSPEFLFKTSNLYVSIKNWSCSGEPLVGSFFGARALFGANLNTVNPLGDIRDLDLVVSNQEILYVSIYKSM